MTQSTNLQLGIPKGRMFEGIRALFAEAGCALNTQGRDYRVSSNLEGFATKLLKPPGRLPRDLQGACLVSSSLSINAI